MRWFGRSAPTEPAGALRSVLLVDDCDAMRRLLRRALRQAGVPAEAVVEATDGAAALAALDRLAVTHVLADQSLPDMTGVQLLDAVGRRPGVDCRRVLVTADRCRDTMREAQVAAVSGLLLKPFTPEQVGDVLDGELLETAAVLAGSDLLPQTAGPALPAEHQVQALLQTLLSRSVQLSLRTPVLPRTGQPALTVAYVDGRLRTVATLAAERSLCLALQGALELEPEHAATAARPGAASRTLLQEIAEVAATLFVPDGGPCLRVYQLHLPGELPPRVTGVAVAAMRSRLDLEVEIDGYGRGGLSLVVPSGGGALSAGSP